MSSNRGYHRMMSVIDELVCLIRILRASRVVLMSLIGDIRTLFSQQTFGLFCAVNWLLGISNTRQTQFEAHKAKVKHFCKSKLLSTLRMHDVTYNDCTMSRT